MEKELIQELFKLKEMYEKKIEEAREIHRYEDQVSHDWMALAYGEIVFDLELLLKDYI